VGKTDDSSPEKTKTKLKQAGMLKVRVPYLSITIDLIGREVICYCYQGFQIEAGSLLDHIQIYP
jgi:hypothetical protein